MSGALVDLVSKGAQDVYLTGKPEVSFFRSAYKRHTNFSFRPYRLDYTGTFNANHDVVVKIPPKGDLLSYIWIENAEINKVTSSNSLVNTLTGLSPTDIELYIGGQLIDRQDSMFQSLVWPYAGYADTTSKCDATQPWAYSGDTTDSDFFPLHFFFCDSYKNALPMLALQYHEVEIRIKCRPGLNDLGGAPKIYANYIFLDTDERQHFVDSDQQILIPQVQRISVGATDTSIDTSYFNHPVQALHLASSSLYEFNSMSLYINGTNLFEDMSDTYFHNVVPYHHAKHTPQHVNSDKHYNPLYTLTFTLSMSWTQPGGSLNFSRLDNSTIKIDSPTIDVQSPVYLYAVNWNVLRLKNGMAGLAFSN